MRVDMISCGFDRGLDSKKYEKPKVFVYVVVVWTGVLTAHSMKNLMFFGVLWF